MTIVLRNGTIWDATGNAPTERGVLLIEDRHIAAVGSEQTVGIPDGAEVVDVEGGFILPGLIDSHNHLGLATDVDILDQIHAPDARISQQAIHRGWRHLRSGVTTMRLCGERNFMDVEWRDGFASELLPGPRLVVSGPGLTARHGHMAHAWSTIVQGPESVREAVRTNIRNGADFIKLFITGSRATRWTQPRTTYLSRAEIEMAIDEAHRAGRPVTAHCHGGEGLLWALEAGIDCIEHGANFTEEEVCRIAAAGIPQVITLGVYFDTHVPAPDALDHIHPRYQPSFEATGRSYKAGTPIAAGADTRHANYNLVFELQCLLKCGLTTEDALLAATRRGAEVCRLKDSLGTLEPGKLADVLVVKGNPLEDVTALANVVRVYKEGRLVDVPAEVPVRSSEGPKAGPVY